MYTIPIRTAGLRLFVIAFFMLCFSSCDINFLGDCFNSGPDPGPGHGVLELPATAPGSENDTDLPMYQYSEGVKLFAGIDHSSRSLISMDRTGQYFFVDSHFFSIQRDVQAPADTLSFCSFIPNTDRHVCVENREERIENPFTNDSVSVNPAHASLSIWENFVKQQAPLYSVSAQFISADQFEITRILHPVFSEDEQEVVFIRQTETRQVIPGSTEQEILSEQNDLVLLDRADNETLRVLLPSLEINNNQSEFLSISPDGRYIAVSLDFDEFVLFDRLSSATTPYLSHSKPSFSPSGRYFFSVDRKEYKLLVFDLEVQSVVDSLALARNEVYSAHPEEDILYYVPDGRAPEIASGTHIVSYTIGTQQQEPVTLLHRDEVTYMTEGRLSSLFDQYFIGVTEDVRLKVFVEVGSTFYDPDSDCN